MLALGFCELLLVLFGFDELPAGLLSMPFEFGVVFDALPLPLRVMRSFTRRLPANELAMRRAVCFSFPVCTFPPTSIVLSVTFTLRLSFFKVGSLCRAFWIWLCKVAVSLAPTPAVVVEGAPAIPGVPVGFAEAPALAPIALAPGCVPLAVPPMVAPVTPPLVLGVLLAD